MDELRGNEAVWGFDSERIKIRYEAKGWFKNPLHKQLGVLEIPVGAIRSVDFRPKAGADGGEPEQTLIMAATAVAHVWARGAATRPALVSGEVTGADVDDRPDLTDPGWWRDAAQSAVKCLVAPRAGRGLWGLRGRGDEDTAALGEGGRRGRAEEGAHRFHRTVEARSRHRMGLRPDRTSGRAQGEGTAHRGGVHGQEGRTPRSDLRGRFTGRGPRAHRRAERSTQRWERPRWPFVGSGCHALAHGRTSDVAPRSERRSPSTRT